MDKENSLRLSRDCFNIKTYTVKNKEPFYHDHNFFEIGFVADGLGEHLCEGRYPLCEGECYCIGTSTAHATITSSKIKIIVLMLDKSFISNKKPFILPQETLAYFGLDKYLSNKHSFFERLSFESPKIKRIASILFQAEEALDKNEETMSALRIYEALILASKSNKESKIQRPINDKVVRGIALITENFKKPLSLENVADAMGLSASYAGKLFKEETGYTPFELISEKRLSEAMKLLRETDMSISEVALNSGYESLSLFNRLFKENTAIAPRNYRKQSQENYKSAKQIPDL